MTEHIQINDVAPRVQYLADGIQSAFTFPFAIFKLADIEVWLDDSLQSSGYAVSGAGVSTGGVALFAVPPAAGSRITLRRRLTIARTTDYQSDGLIRAKTLNDELDYQVAALQQVAEDVDRTIRRAPTALAVVDLTLPEPAAGRGLKWNADGTRLINSTNDPDAAGDISQAAQQAAAAAQAAVAASAQAVAAAVSISNPLSAASNLADVEDAELARANLGVPSVADLTVSSRTVETAIALDDLALIHDTSAGADRQISIGNLLKAASLLTVDASPDKEADYVMTWDASAGEVKKVLLSDLGGAGAWEYVGTADVNATVGAVAFTGLAGGYDYRMVIESVYCSGTNQTLALYTYVGGVLQSSGYSWNSTNLNGAAAAGSSSGGSAYLELVSGMGGSAGSTYVTGEIDMLHQNGATGYRLFGMLYNHYVGGSADSAKLIYGRVPGPPDGFLFQVSGGVVLTGGEFRLYRRKRSA